MADSSQQRPGRTDASGMRELLGLRARLVGDELIDEQGRVLAVTNRQAFRVWLRSSSAFPSLAASAALAPQEE
ncbi:MAG TPA: hypothetical protein VNN62_16885 [Methylomirabilota bacterium]|nr:hypothetical protein [Methylomirabilota bacterium]HZT34913.1 hypothetical protein [Nitrososphaera sp.]